MAVIRIILSQSSPRHHTQAQVLVVAILLFTLQIHHRPHQRLSTQTRLLRRLIVLMRLPTLPSLAQPLRPQDVLADIRLCLPLPPLLNPP